MEDIDRVYSLQREHARRQLAWKASLLQGKEQDGPSEYTVKLEGFSQGRGFVFMHAIRGSDRLNLWLFPQSLPAYLTYVDILRYLDGGAYHSLLCRQSEAHDLFLIEIKKPL
jgi:hypothetical protein